MRVIARNTLALLAGVVVGGLVNMAIVMLGPMLIPPPPGVAMTSAEGLTAGMHLLESKHFVMPFLAHAVGTYVGAVVAYLVAVSFRARFAYAIGVFFLAGGIAASFMIPAPAWFIALDLLVAYLPMAWLATKIAARLTRHHPQQMPERP